MQGSGPKGYTTLLKWAVNIGMVSQCLLGQFIPGDAIHLPQFPVTLYLPTRTGWLCSSGDEHFLGSEAPYSNLCYNIHQWDTVITSYQTISSDCGVLGQALFILPAPPVLSTVSGTKLSMYAK